MTMNLYQCVERGAYEDPYTFWGWFDSDREAVEAFQKKIDSHERNDCEDGYYVGRFAPFDGIDMSPKTVEVAIIQWRQRNKQ